MTTDGRQVKSRVPVRKLAGALLLLAGVAVLVVVGVEFRGGIAAKTQLTMLASRSGLVLDLGSKVTYNGVPIGRVVGIDEVDRDGKPAAKLLLNVEPKYVEFIPANVDADITATTVFGNKYVSFTTPKNPVPQRIAPQQVIVASSVTTEFNTVFETLTSISEKVDPVKLNMTLSAAAEALTGLGDQFGAALANGNAILDDVNPRMPQIRFDLQRLADLGDVYADAAPDLFSFLDNSVTTAKTFNQQQDDVDAALLAAVGFGNTGADVLGRSEPFLVRALADLVPTAKLLDTYSPEVFCVLHDAAELVPKVTNVLSGNGPAAQLAAQVLGAENPYVYPDNLPRTNASGGPGGRPGCWAKITRDLWPAPFQVMDSGNSIAPYNHFEIGSPYAIEYVWGRQVGENTINP